MTRWSMPPTATAANSAPALPMLLVALCATGIAAAAAGVHLQRIWTLLLLAPLLEEAVFRAGLQEALLGRLRWQPLLANGVTALAFGCAHVVLREDAAAFAVVLPALLIGLHYQRSGRLRGCVALHAAMNAVWLVWDLVPAAAQAFG